MNWSCHVVSPLTQSLNHSASLWHVSLCLRTRGVNLGDGGTRPPEFGVQHRNSLKFGHNFFYRNPKLLQLLGDFVPQTLYRGFAPGPHWKTSVPQTPCTGRPPTFCTRFTPLLRIHDEFCQQTSLHVTIVCRLSSPTRCCCPHSCRKSHVYLSNQWTVAIFN